ncbi:hypothetical protein L596_011762 [Steinernema carpocapsae]|uniref:Fungal lipase-type domain-containing protein n=1 Tax=Steinernema carpocapsae TaxID=34508 RepID=A0A4U5NVV8_STECR|nr:hypothetical protein L596_011762 [Steinernema carpocapsae]
MRSAAAFLLAALLGSALSSAIRKDQKLDAYAYTDEFARFKMLSFSAAAYADDPSLCMKTAFPHGNGTISKVVEVVCDMIKTDSCRGFTAYSHSDKAIIISFRGTAEFIQLATESVGSIIGSEKFIAGGFVSHYFYEAFKKVWNGGLKDDYLELRNKYPDYEVWVTGHSLGGAMATLCASTLIHEGVAEITKTKLMTFGCPRVGDRAFADAHDALMLYSYRVVHKADIVAHVPPMFWPDHNLLDPYRHTKSEVWYDNDMSEGSDYNVCNAQESDSCSDKLWFTLSIPDHLHYFETAEWMPDYGEDGCPVKYITAQ